jgi:hypothetical protein
MYDFIEKLSVFEREIEIFDCSNDKNSSIGQWRLKIIQKIKIKGYAK